MKVLVFVLCGILLAAVSAEAQTDSSRASASGKVWIDLFLGPDGDVVYPQYAWEVKTLTVSITGYGFLERAPGEPLFTNHVNALTLSKFSMFSVRTETGGAPARSAYYFQPGVQVNLHNVFRLKKAQHLVVAQLPNLVGARPPNTLIAGATQRFGITRGVAVSFEGYRRFFPGERADYSEYWALVHLDSSRHVEFGTFLLQDGRTTSFAFGGRISP